MMPGKMLTTNQGVPIGPSRAVCAVRRPHGRLVNEAGKSVFCKCHWRPLLGTHSLVWDEAVKIMEADPDLHRRDLSNPATEWEIGVQLFTEDQAEAFSFHVLDSTELVPEELVPVTLVGRMVLNRNPVRQKPVE